MIDATRGVLFPERLPTFTRLEPIGRVAALVRWYWIPEWDLAPGQASAQQLVGYPAVNLVVEPGGVSLSGPTTRSGRRELTGRGWAVGALLRPAATAALAERPEALVDRLAAVRHPELHAAVAAAMSSADAGERHAAATAAFSAWLEATVPPPAGDALLANAMADLLLQDAGILHVGDAADRLGVSPRTLQRLARRYVGVPPAAMIRRRRLQEAAQRLRERPDADLAALAAELGYADHAHLTRDFRTVLSFTPSEYRAVREP
ncbi:helix-turn-helix domain-containing protein [Microbacterium sp. No. 7]|uniref:helix-turn-helix domain-containing protein n=1 Tax=Microbacterium sp. No. 7 TaxID=1714373 RepID=UPI0006D28F02|nr:helix-turn-helix domain-containing protein [Microbacterium sp. No. 7]